LNCQQNGWVSGHFYQPDNQVCQVNNGFDDGFTRSVALHEVLHKFVYTFLFFGGIVSISLLPSSIKTMASGYVMDKMAIDATS
jgi:hypothetical protein